MEPIYDVGDLHVDWPARTVTWRGAAVALTETLFEILNILTRQPGRRFSRDAIADACLREESDPQVVSVHVVRLRRAFRNVDPDFAMITTRFGAGYAWSVH